MPALDFKEIATAAAGSTRDQFELFAREFLELLGLKVLVGPDRGTDAGRDLIVEERRVGIAGETRVKWLVSCKHKAHSGGAVYPDDEPDIHDRVRTHGCNGFLGFYSTVPSAGLAAKLHAPGLSFEVQVFDSEKIERQLLSRGQYLELTKRFFPVSCERWKKDHPSPAKLFEEDPNLFCAYCKNSLLQPKPHGIVVLWTISSRDDTGSQDHTEHVYWCCKGKCDKILKRQYARDGITDVWDDITDLTVPPLYVRWVMTLLNELHSGKTYSNEALESMKTLLLNLFPLISRDMSAQEEERIRSLSMIPDFLGGLG